MDRCRRRQRVHRYSGDEILHPGRRPDPAVRCDSGNEHLTKIIALTAGERIERSLIGERL